MNLREMLEMVSLGTARECEGTNQAAYSSKLRHKDQDAVRERLNEDLRVHPVDESCTLGRRDGRRVCGGLGRWWGYPRRAGQAEAVEIEERRHGG